MGYRREKHIKEDSAEVKHLKWLASLHPTGLTPNILKLFAPQPPIEFKPPPEEKKYPSYTGIAQFVKQFAEPEDPEYAPPVKETETPAQKKIRIHNLKLEKGAAKVAEDIEKYDPQNDSNATGDPYKTLFVSRLNFETSEGRLKWEFETYGPIKQVKMIYDKETNKPKGYAFIEYVHTRDMIAAYKQADGRKIDGRRVKVDVERGRTVQNWLPRRLGGGLGTTRAGAEDVNQRHDMRNREYTRESGRERGKPHERSHDKSRGRDHSDDRGRDRDNGKGEGSDREFERGKPDERSYDKSRRRDHNDDRGRDNSKGKRSDGEFERGKHRARPLDRYCDKSRDYECGEASSHSHRHSKVKPYDKKRDGNRMDVDTDCYDEMEED